MVANGAKNVLAKGTATFVSGPGNLPNKALINPPD